MLAASGWRIDSALDGNEALRLYRMRGPYDLVLTDIYHPGPSGMELVKRIRQKNSKQAIAVVSAVGDVMAIRRRFQIPVFPIPFDKHQLVSLVESSTNPHRRVLMVAGDSAVRPLTAARKNFEIELEFNGDKALKHYRKHGPYDIVVTGIAIVVWMALVLGR